jgi:hypothetical protein
MLISIYAVVGGQQTSHFDGCFSWMDYQTIVFFCEPGASLLDAVSSPTRHHCSRASKYSHAVMVASTHAHLGGEVVRLHEEWGDCLVSSGQTDSAINHFVEAGANAKAAKAAVDAGNLARAAALIDVLPVAEQEELSSRLAALFQAARNLPMAATYYVRAGRATAAVHMYFDAHLWDEAHKVSSSMGPRWSPLVIRKRQCYRRHAACLQSIHICLMSSHKSYLRAAMLQRTQSWRSVVLAFRPSSGV